jgi:hypothetical protein
MTLLLTYWKQFAMLALFLAGVYLGYSYEHAKFETFVAKVETQAKVAEALVAEKEKRQKAISENITKEYANAVNKIKKHYASVSLATSVRVLNNNTSGSEVSHLSNTSTGVDENTEDFVPNSFGGQDLVLHCSQDVLQLLFLQKWVEEQLKY